MLEFQLTLMDGTRHRARFTNKEIAGDIMNLIHSLDLLCKVGIEDDKECDDVKHVYVRGYRSEVCNVHLHCLRNLEYIEFQRGLTGLKKLILPPHKHQVMNIPLNLERLICSSYATITNMDELLETTDVDLKMRM